MEVRELICINCPLGCPLTVETDGGTVKSVTGNTCPRGDAYARSEVTDPRRTVTTTVVLRGGRTPVLPVRTAAPVPKAAVPRVLAALKHVTLTAPVAAGTVVLADAAGTGVDVVTTAADAGQGG